MSRIGNNPVKLPPKVEVTLGTGEISVKGPLGTLSRSYGRSVTIEKDGEELVFKATQRRSRRACRARCARWSRTWSRASPRASRRS